MGTESDRHQRYKERLKYVLSKNGWGEVCNEALRKTKTENWPGREFFKYGLDVYGEKDGIQLGVEVDNPGRGGGHRSTRERAKDRVRSKQLYEQHRIIVLRLEFWQIKDTTDDELYEEIQHELNKRISEPKSNYK